MYDKFNRQINYLRISVTDRCNLRCIYCMSANEIKWLKHEDILRFEEIIEFTKIAVDKGIDKVRITGGEPLVRKGIVHFVYELSKISGIKDLSLTTNAVLLNEYAQALKDAGLHRINISLDTINPGKYKKITKGGNIRDVMKGIDAAQKAELNPIKINCVVNESTDAPDTIKVKNFCQSRQLEVRFIHRMKLSTGKFAVVENGTGGNCKICNKLRLSSDGNVHPCLFSDITFNIKELGAKKAILLALNAKPEYGTISFNNKFNLIGG